jgi:hypothetical protein
MPYSRLLIAMLLLATVLVDAVAISLASTSAGLWDHWSDPRVVILYALVGSQLTLVSIWAGLGKKSMPWRLTAAFLITIVWASVLTKLTPVGGFRAFLPTDVSALYLCVLSRDTLVVLASFSITRVLGVRVVREPLTRSCAESDPFRWQFTLRHLFAWTTAIAVCLGLFQYTATYKGFWDAASFIVPNVAGFPGSYLLAWRLGAAIVSIWVALGNQRLTARLASLAFPLLPVVMVASRPQWGLRPLAVQAFLELLMMLGSLWVLRIAGYRLCIIRKKKRKEAIGVG